MRRSDMAEQKAPPLTDEGEHRRNLEEIRKLVLENAFSFEDIISKMGTIVRPDLFSKVTFDDFFRVVAAYCGA